MPSARMSSLGTDECPDEIRCARHGHEFHGVKMIRMKKTGDEKPMEDNVLERNKNLNRGFRKLAPVK